MSLTNPIDLAAEERDEVAERLIAANHQPEEPPPNAIVQIQGMTLADLVQTVLSVDRLVDLSDEEFKPESLVGQLILDPAAGEELRLALRNKVDALWHVVTEFEAYAARTKARAMKLQNRAQIAANRANSIMDYINGSMALGKFDQLNGNEFVLKRKRASNPRLLLDREANAQDMLEFGEELVKEIPAQYVWDEKVIKDQLKALHKQLAALPVCKACNGSLKIVQDHDIIACDNCAGLGKEIGDAFEVPVSASIGRIEYSYRAEFAERDEVAVAKPRKKK